MLSLGRSSIYKLMDDGRLKSVKVDKRRLVIVDSIHQLIARLIADAA